MKAARSWMLAVAGLVAAAPRATAQASDRGARLQPEVRGDMISRGSWRGQAGLGLSAPAGTYVRLHLVGAVGTVRPRVGRVDLMGRFVLDPFREHRWGPYGAAGVSQWVGPGARTYIAVALGVEAPAVRGYLPTLEVGLGGGTRIGLIARREIRGAR